jgi:hypothetical protein
MFGFVDDGKVGCGCSQVEVECIDAVGIESGGLTFGDIRLAFNVCLILGIADAIGVRHAIACTLIGYVPSKRQWWVCALAGNSDVYFGSLLQITTS